MTSMVLQVDPRTLGENLFLIIGVVFLLGLAAAIGLAAWIGVKVWRQAVRERRSWAQHQVDRLGPDGKPYPPYLEGVCEVCKRGDHRVYHLKTGEMLCQRCYEAFCLERRGPAAEKSGSG
jgi:hypothetical protein